VLLNPPARVLELPASDAHQQVHAVAAATHVVLAAALIAEPAARAVVLVPPVAIPTAARRAGLVAIGELIRRQAAKLHQQPRPAAVCCI
jgi:hypothetical protein